MKQKFPEPPKHLSNETSLWWKQLVEDYALEPHHLRLLRLACEAWDRCQQAREAIEEHGLTCQDRFGQVRTRPEVQIERDSRIAFARILRELALDVSEPGESRPPTIAGNSHLRMTGD